MARARLGGVVEGPGVQGRVTYHHEARLVPFIAMKEGFEALPGRPQIGEKAVAQHFT